MKRMVDESNKNAALDVDRQLEEFDMVKKNLGSVRRSVIRNAMQEKRQKKVKRI